MLSVRFSITHGTVWFTMAHFESWLIIDDRMQKKYLIYLIFYMVINMELLQTKFFGWYNYLLTYFVLISYTKDSIYYLFDKILKLIIELKEQSN